jgi:hypothetical protein
MRYLLAGTLLSDMFIDFNESVTFSVTRREAGPTLGLLGLYGRISNKRLSIKCVFPAEKNFAVAYAHPATLNCVVLHS